MNLPPVPDALSGFEHPSPSLIGLQLSDAELRWLGLSLCPDYYLQATLDQRTAAKAILILRGLGGVGLATLRLCILDLAYERGISAGDANDEVQRMADPARRVISADLALSDCLGVTPELSTRLKDPAFHRRVERHAVDRFLGVLTVGHRYELLRQLVMDATYRLRHEIPAVASYKSALQEYLAPAARPTYEAIGESGPAHDRLFRRKVSTSDGRGAVGEGPSKRKAEEAAARAFLEQFASPHLRELSAQTRTAAFSTPRVSGTRLQSLGPLADAFQIPKSDAAVLNVAVTHPVRQADQAEHRNVLAQLGAAVLEVVARWTVFTEAIERARPDSDAPLALVVMAALGEEASAQMFDRLYLDDVYIRPSGLKLSLRVKADTFQALLGSAFVATRKPQPNLLPPPAAEVLLGAVHSALHRPAPALLDAKSRLQTRLVAIGLVPSYGEKHFGPAHERRFRSVLSLTDDQGRQHLTVTGKQGRSRKEADKQVAASLNRVLDVVNERLGMTDIDTWAANGKKLATFLLAQEASFAASHTAAVELTRLAQSGALGAKLLLNEQFMDFHAWAVRAEALMNHASRRPSLMQLDPFYRHLGTLKGERSGFRYTDSIELIARFVESISLEEGDISIQDSEAFRELLAMASVTRIMARPIEIRPLDALLSDITLLRRNERPSIRLNLGLPAIGVQAHAGAFHALMGLVVDELFVGALEIGVSAALKQHVNTVELTCVARPAASDRGLNQLPDSPLLHFCFNEFPGLDIAIDAPDTARISFESHPQGAEALGDIALSAYRRPAPVDFGEAEALARMLHDLKNHLVAAEVALSGGGSDRTSQLRARHEASQHLDSALSICNTIRGMRRSLAPPCAEPLDFGRFLREYFAEKYAVMPPEIELAIPSRADEIVIWTDRAYVRSILDNLIKNALEALDGPGRVECDWIADHDGSRVLLEVTDNGSGMADALMADLVAGTAVKSTKEHGSGLGMLSVVSMVGRLGGSIDGTSAIGEGTRWTVELPSLEPVEEDLQPNAEADLEFAES